MIYRDGAAADTPPTNAQAATQLFAEAKAHLRRRHAEMDSLARFLDNEKVNNKELDARIAFYDREVVRPT